MSQVHTSYVELKHTKCLTNYIHELFLLVKCTFQPARPPVELINKPEYTTRIICAGILLSKHCLVETCRKTVQCSFEVHTCLIHTCFICNCIHVYPMSRSVFTFSSAYTNACTLQARLYASKLCAANLFNYVNICECRLWQLFATEGVNAVPSLYTYRVSCVNALSVKPL